MLNIDTLTPGQIILLVGHRKFNNQKMHWLIVETALLQPVRVLLGGNQFSFYDISYALANITPDYESCLENHIYLSRAETCYQMVQLLTEVKTSSRPILVSDLLNPFYDDGVPEREIDLLLFEAIIQLQRLSKKAPVVVSATEKQIRPRLLNILQQHASQIIRPTIEISKPSLQHELFS